MMRTELIAPLPELLKRQAAAHGHKTAFEDAGRSVTYADLEKRTANLASQLADLGIAPGDTIAMLLPNSVAWVETCFGIERAGAISVPIAYESTEPEIAYRLADANCRVIVTTDEKAGLVAKLRGATPNLKFVVLMDKGQKQAGSIRLGDLLARSGRAAPRDASDIDRPAFIVYTSGTTGRAKGVILTVRGMLWVAASCWAPICGLNEHDTVLSPLPLFHSYALNLSVLSILAVGATEHIMERWSTAEALVTSPHRPVLLHARRADDVPLSAAAGEGGRRAGSDRGTAARRVGRRDHAGDAEPGFEDHFGVPLLDGYGITETSTMVTMNWRAGTRVLGLMRACRCRGSRCASSIRRPAAMSMPTAEGELIVRGPNVMPGYHNKPEETAAALREGWYRTGDLAKPMPTDI